MQKLNYGLVINLPTEKIEIKDDFVRRWYGEKALEELGQSMAEIGPIYPVLVQKIVNQGERYELIIGSRRLKAAQKIGLKEIPGIIITSIDDQQKLEFALAENLHREDLTPFEEAWAVLRLIKDFKMSTDEIARKIGRSPSFVRSRLQLISLPEEAQNLIAQKQISINNAKILASLAAPEDQIRFAHLIAEHGLSEEEILTAIQEESGKQMAKRRYRKPLTGKRTTLKISRFLNWLDSVMPEVLEMSKEEIIDVRMALQRVIAEATKAIEDTKPVLAKKEGIRHATRDQFVGSIGTESEREQNLKQSH